MFNYNFFLFFNLPSAYWSGVRVKSIDDKTCLVKVRHNWFNKNPYKSIFWAVQGMSAELSTGLLLNQEIRNRKIKVSMLVISNSSKFFKKAVGKIIFKCNQGNEVKKIFDKLDKEKPTNKIVLFSNGMSAELSTGLLLNQEIRNRKIKVSMLVISNSSKFFKKAVGKIIFKCNQGNEVKKIFDKLDKEKPTNKIVLFSNGIDEVGDVVSEFKFEWSLKRKF